MQEGLPFSKTARGREGAIRGNALDAAVQTRAQWTHYRLRWQQRMARNAHLSSAFSFEVTIHGLPRTFAQSINLDGVSAA